MVNIKPLSNPLALIGIFISVIMLVEVAKILFPMVIDGFAALSGIANFTFAGLFAGNSLFQVIMSVILLVTALAVLGISIGSGSKR